MLLKKKKKLILSSTAAAAHQPAVVPLQLAAKKSPVKLKLAARSLAPVPLKIAAASKRRTSYDQDSDNEDAATKRKVPKFEPKYKPLNNSGSSNKQKKRIPLSLQPSHSFIDSLEKSYESSRLSGDDDYGQEYFDDESDDAPEFDPMEVLRKAAIEKAQANGVKLEPGFEPEIKVEPINYDLDDDFDDDLLDEEEVLNPKRKEKRIVSPKKRKRKEKDFDVDTKGKKYEDYKGEISMTAMTLEAYVVSKSSEVKKQNIVKLEEIEDSFSSTAAKKRSDRHIYACSFCPFSNFKREWLLHLRKSHENRGLMFCSFNATCNLPFTCKDAMEKHVAVEHQDKHTCKVCGKTFKHPYMLKEHMPSHLDEDDDEKRQHICSYCGKKFQTKRGLKSHEAHYHTMQLEHKCDWEGCERAYFTANELVIHKRSHTGEQPFVCSYCGTGFVKKTGLNQHERAVHLGVYDKEVSFVQLVSAKFDFNWIICLFVVCLFGKEPL